MGPVQLAYSPGEVFPFTEIRGPIDEVAHTHLNELKWASELREFTWNAKFYFVTPPRRAALLREPAVAIC